jgi:large subunit ribosomal protein L15
VRKHSASPDGIVGLEEYGIMQLNDVHQGVKGHRRRKRVGRGIGSGHGRTCGRGEKGHSSRSGHSYRLAFEGGQKQLFRKVAKRGFSNNFFAPKVVVVNLYDLEETFDAGAVVDEAALRKARLVTGRCDLVKLLATGEITKALTVRVDAASEAAIAKLTASGGKFEQAAGKACEAAPADEAAVKSRRKS